MHDGEYYYKRLKSLIDHKDLLKDLYYQRTFQELYALALEAHEEGDYLCYII